MEKITNNIRQVLEKYHVKFLHFVDISDLPEETIQAFPTAVLFGLPLPADFIRTINNNTPIRYNMFDLLEERMKRLADFVAAYLTFEGYKATSQSDEEQLLKQTYNETIFRSRLPHKTLALRAGLGWIGKNDLCNTNHYGCAISMCSILTDAPFKTVKCEPAPPKCGKCTACADVCPTAAISGKCWQMGVDRNELINPDKCILCLKCMAVCPFTKAKLRNR